MKGRLLALLMARSFAIAAVLLGAAALGGCAFLRISRPADIAAYCGMVSECHPVWKQFALRRFNLGDLAFELFRRFPPDSREEFGRYGVYDYYRRPEGIQFTGFRVVTRDSKLLSAGAGSCTWQFTFFRTEDTELDRQYAAYWKEKSERWKRESLGRVQKIGEPDSAANGSQPDRSDTNRTSSATGSRR